jgi:hypothetical protein
VRAIRILAIEKGLVTDDELDRKLDDLAVAEKRE